MGKNVGIKIYFVAVAQVILSARINFPVCVYVCVLDIMQIPVCACTYQGSISPTFYEQLLLALIPKAQKDRQVKQLYFAFGIS